jgi:hypothetical protein
MQVIIDGVPYYPRQNVSNKVSAAVAKKMAKLQDGNTALAAITGLTYNMQPGVIVSINGNNFVVHSIYLELEKYHGA